MSYLKTGSADITSRNYCAKLKLFLTNLAKWP